MPVTTQSVFTSDRAYLYACILPRYLFLRAFRRIAPIGASISNRLSYPESVILSRNDDFIPRPSGKDKADVKAKCFDVQVSFPCVGLGVGEWPAERQRSIVGMGWAFLKYGKEPSKQCGQDQE